MVTSDLPVDGVGCHVLGVDEIFYPTFKFDEAECVARPGYCYGVDRGWHVYYAVFAAVYFLDFIEVDYGGRDGEGAAVGRLAQ